MSPDKIRIAGVVVLYKSPGSVVQNIETYRSELEVLYVIDNSPEHNIELFKKLNHLENIKYFTTGKNIGIAAALNIAAWSAMEEGYEYLLTMDQDSAASENMIRVMLDYILGDPCIGLISPLHVDRNAPPKLPPTEDVEQIQVAMTSGNIIRLSIYRDIGGFLEKLFIDCVDLDYCLKLHRNGYFIVRANKAILTHSMGHFTPHKFFGMTVYPSNYSPPRFYYQTRNRFYIYREYRKSYPDYCNYDRKMYFRWILKMLLYEKERLRKILMICRGFLALWRNDFSPIKMD